MKSVQAQDIDRNRRPIIGHARPIPQLLELERLTEKLSNVRITIHFLPESDRLN